MVPRVPQGVPYASQRDVPVWLQAKSQQKPHNNAASSSDRGRALSHRARLMQQQREEAPGQQQAGWQPENTAEKVQNLPAAEMRANPSTQAKWAPGTGQSEGGNWVPGGYNKMSEGVAPAACLVNGDAQSMGRPGTVVRNALDPASFPEKENPNFDTASVPRPPGPPIALPPASCSQLSLTPLFLPLSGATAPGPRPRKPDAYRKAHL